jgi:hypothetical protein
MHFDDKGRTGPQLRFILIVLTPSKVVKYEVS